MKLRGIWSFHPGIHRPEGMRIGDWLADKVRNGMGSWIFVLIALLFLGAWMVYNGSAGFDPFPFILLNLVLSCVAALQGSILLIAAKREDQISAELAKYTLKVDEENLELTREIAKLTKEIHKMSEQLARTGIR
jgi:uncharacterized membrane protein